MDTKQKHVYPPGTAIGIMLIQNKAACLSRPNRLTARHITAPSSLPCCLAGDFGLLVAALLHLRLLVPLRTREIPPWHVLCFFVSGTCWSSSLLCGTKQTGPAADLLRPSRGAANRKRIQFRRRPWVWQVAMDHVEAHEILGRFPA